METEVTDHPMKNHIDHQNLHIVRRHQKALIGGHMETSIDHHRVGRIDEAGRV
jgi:hypothetical protein